MDTVTAAIIAAIGAVGGRAGAGVLTGLSDAAAKAITEGYEGLKTVLKSKFGDQSELVKAVDGLEARPASDSRKATLAEEVSTASADQDPEVVQLARTLIGRIQAQPGGEQHVQQAIGNYIAQADRGGRAKVHINQPPQQP